MKSIKRSKTDRDKLDKSRISPINPNTIGQKPRIFFLLIKDIFPVLIAFFLLILLSAVCIFIASRNNTGIVPTFTAPDSIKSCNSSQVSFADCLHFSVVTITTLGYGDFRPIGWGRIFADFEAVGGLVLAGLLIAKLVSRKQDRRIGRITSGMMNIEVQNFRKLINALQHRFAKIDQMRDAETNEIKSDFTELMYNASGLFKSIARYWRYESASPDIVEIIQTKSTGRLLLNMVDILMHIARITESENSATIHENHRIYIRNISESTLTLADILDTRIGDDWCLRYCIEAYTLITQLRERFSLNNLLPV